MQSLYKYKELITRFHSGTGINNFIIFNIQSSPMEESFADVFRLTHHPMSHNFCFNDIGMCVTV